MLIQNFLKQKNDKNQYISFLKCNIVNNIKLCNYLDYDIIQNKIKIMNKLMYEQNRLWDYQILKQLGKGQYGHVYQVRLKKDNKIYALKKINIAGTHEKQKIQAFRQIKALKLISHPNIIQYHDSFLSMDNIYIVTEFAEKGDLSVEIQNRIRKEKKFMEEQLWEIFQSLVSAVKCLHDKHIIHRDIKLENIFLTGKGVYKVGDLGMSKMIYDNSDMLSTRVGTPIYFAPEIIQHKLYSFPVDIWSLGCVFYYLAALEHPYKDATIQTLGYYIVDKDPKPIKGPYSPQLISFILSLLQKNPQKRPTIYDLYRKLKERKQPNVQTKVYIYDFKQILSLRASYAQQKSKQTQKIKNQERIQTKPRLFLQAKRKLNQSFQNDDNPERKSSVQDLYKRNSCLYLPKGQKILRNSNDKQYGQCSPFIKSTGFSLHLNSPEKLDLISVQKNKSGAQFRMAHTIRSKGLNNGKQFNISLNESPLKNNKIQFPKKARARVQLN